MKRSSRVFDPTATTPFRVSRSKIDLFLECPRCFYLDRRLGISRPSTPPFTLNSAVDLLLKREFDYYRERGEPHPMLTENGIDAIPFKHVQMEAWRDALRRGVEYAYPGTRLVITGGVDDVWVTPKEELIIVDYKATAKSSEVSLDAPWQISYKRQMEVYQWLFRMNGFAVNPVGYFVYCNGDLSSQRFDQCLKFSIKLLSYEGKPEWIPPTIDALNACLHLPHSPAPRESCAYCDYCFTVADA